jgi:hypothetical protein
MSLKFIKLEKILLAHTPNTERNGCRSESPKTHPSSVWAISY